jgi:spore maturation protein CgeB
MYRLLARSQVAVNVHIGVAGGLAGNMRMFEATGCGALLLTEQMPNLGEMFEPEVEAVGYAGTDDLVLRLRGALERPEETATIARRGQQRTLRDHSSEVRARTLEAIFQDLLQVT